MIFSNLWHRLCATWPNPSKMMCGWISQRPGWRQETHRATITLSLFWSINNPCFSIAYIFYFPPTWTKPCHVSPCSAVLSAANIKLPQNYIFFKHLQASLEYLLNICFTLHCYDHFKSLGPLIKKIYFRKAIQIWDLQIFYAFKI